MMTSADSERLQFRNLCDALGRNDPNYSSIEVDHHYSGHPNSRLGDYGQALMDNTHVTRLIIPGFIACYSPRSSTSNNRNNNNSRSSSSDSDSNSDNDVENEMAKQQAWAQYLQHSTSLQTVHITSKIGRDDSLRYPCAEWMTNALVKNRNVTEFLYDCRFDSVATFLRLFPKSKILRRLRVPYVDFTFVEHQQLFFNALEKISTLQTLELFGIRLSPATADFINNLIAVIQRLSAVALAFADHTRADAAAVLPITRAITSYLSTTANLTEFSISHSFDNAGMAILIQGLRDNTSITKLGLIACHFTEQADEAFATYMQEENGVVEEASPPVPALVSVDGVWEDTVDAAQVTAAVPELVADRRRGITTLRFQSCNNVAERPASYGRTLPWTLLVGPRGSGIVSLELVSPSKAFLNEGLEAYADFQSRDLSRIKIVHLFQSDTAWTGLVPHLPKLLYLRTLELWFNEQVSYHLYSNPAHRNFKPLIQALCRNGSLHKFVIRVTQTSDNSSHASSGADGSSTNSSVLNANETTRVEAFLQRNRELPQLIVGVDDNDLLEVQEQQDTSVSSNMSEDRETHSAPSRPSLFPAVCEAAQPTRPLAFNRTLRGLLALKNSMMDDSDETSEAMSLSFVPVHRSAVERIAVVTGLDDRPEHEQLLENLKPTVAANRWGDTPPRQGRANRQERSSNAVMHMPHRRRHMAGAQGRPSRSASPPLIPRGFPSQFRLHHMDMYEIDEDSDESFHPMDMDELNESPDNSNIRQRGTRFLLAPWRFLLAMIALVLAIYMARAPRGNAP